MASKSVSAKEVLRDFRSGMSDAQLKEKYKLSDKGLSVLFKKMMDAGIIKEAELKQRSHRASPSVRQAQPTIQPPSGLQASPARQAPSGAHAPSSTRTGDGIDEAFAQALVEDVRKGLHNNEIMRRYDLAPNRLKSILTQLLERGSLTQEEYATRFQGKLVICPACSGQNPEGTETCRHCGGDVRKPFAPRHEQETAAPPIPPPAPPVLPAQDTEPDSFSHCPWEQRESYGLWNAYIQTAGKSLFKPVEFFSTLPVSGGYGNPILYAIFSTALSAPIGMVILTLLGQTRLSVTLAGIVFGFMCALIGAAITTPIALFLWSGLIHAALHALKAGQQGFETTFRTIAYASTPQLFTAIPVLGNTVAGVYSIVLAVIGLRETHQISTGKSAAAVGIALGVILLLALALFGIKR